MVRRDIIKLIEANNDNKQLVKSDVVAYVDKLLNHAIIITYYEKDELVGFCAFYANDIKNSKSFLTMIVVNEKNKGKGIGELLIDFWLGYAKKNNFKNCYLEVNKTNNIAASLYRKKNFIEYSDSGDSVIMYCKVS